MEDKEMIDLAQSQMQKMQHSQLSARIDAMLENDNTLQPLIHRGISSRHLDPVNEPPQDAALVLSNLMVEGDEINEMDEDAELPMEEDDYLDMEKFKQLVLDMNFQDLNPNKLLQYLEFLEAQGLHLLWEDDERRKYEGFFLALLINDSKFLGSFAYRPALQRVVSNFVEKFKNEYQEKLNETENILVDDPYLLLLSSFSSDLGSSIEMNGLAEEFASTIDEIPLENIPIILRAITNIIPRCPSLLDKMITYDLISQIMDKLDLDGDSSNLAPFLQLTLAARSTGRASSECLDVDSAGRLLTHLSHKVQSFDELVILSTKFRYKASPVSFLVAGSPLNIAERYFYQNEKIISAKLTKEQFLEYYFFSEIFLEFLKMNISDAVKSYRRRRKQQNLSIKPHNQEQLLKTAMDLFALYNFQPSVSENFLSCLTNRMTRSLVPWTFENVLTPEILLNLSGPFGDEVYLSDDSANKTPTSHPQTGVLKKLQILYLRIIEVLQKNNQGLERPQAKVILDGVWTVRRAISHIQGLLQAAYLAKGLNKFVQKAPQWVNPQLEELERNNLLIIKGLSTCYDMTDVIDYMISNAQKQKLTDSSSGSSANNNKFIKKESKLLKSSDLWSRPIYFAIMSQNEDKMIQKFIESKTGEIEQLAEKMVDATAKTSFQESLSLLDFMNLGLHWIRKKPSISSSDRSLINKVFRALGKMLISTPAFVEINRNHQIFLILERVSLAIHYSASSRVMSFSNRSLFLLKCLMSSDPTLSGSEIDLPSMGVRKKPNVQNQSNVPYKIDPEKVDLIKTSLSEEISQNIVDFLREIIQKKEKSAFINFFAAKVIDWLYISVESFPPLQLQLMETLFKNALEGKFPKELHSIPPYYLISYSGSWLDRPNPFKAYVGLAIREKLFLDRPIRQKLRALLPKGFPLSALEFSTNDERLLFARLICEQSPKKLRNKLLLYLVDLAPKIADRKRPFLSTIRVLEELLGGGEDFREDLLSPGVKDQVDEENEDENVNYLDPTKDKFCKNLATRVLSESSIMKRMQKLYTRDKINLEKVLLILLRIAEKYELMEVLELPDEIVAGSLGTSEKEFVSLDAYTAIETNVIYSDMSNSSPCTNLTGYILKYLSFKPDQLEKHMQTFEKLLPRIKRYLDSQLFFVKKDNRAVASQVEPCIQAIQSICLTDFMKDKEFKSSFFNVEFTVEYLLKFLFCHIEQNPNIELVHLNNLFNYFSNFKMIAPSIQLRSQRRLLSTLIELLKHNSSFYDSSLNLRVVSGLHFITNKKTFENLKDFIWIVICNIFEINSENGETLIEEESESQQDQEEIAEEKEENEENEDDAEGFMEDVINDRHMKRFAKRSNENPSFEMFLDYYFLIDYEFDFTNSMFYKKEEEEEREKKYDNLNSMLLKTHSSITRVAELLSSKNFDKEMTPLILNSIARASLRLSHILKHKPAVFSKKANLITKILDGHKTILDKHFESIHSRPKLEKLILDNLSKLRKAYPVKNNNLAGVFVNILNSQPSFRINSLVDKFAYMGLFTSYCDAKKKLSKLTFNSETADFEVKKNPRKFSSIPDFSNELIRDSILLIGYELQVEREIVLLGFLSKLARTKPDLVFSKKMIPPERILKRLFILTGKLMKTASGDIELTEIEEKLMKKRLRLGKIGIRWLRVGLEEGQKILPSNSNKKNDNLPSGGNNIGDPFWTLNYLSFKYRESINAQYNTLTAHYEPLNVNSSNVYDAHPVTSKNRLTESQIGQAFKQTPTIYGNNLTDLNMGSDFPLTEEVFDACEWLAVQNKSFLEKNCPLIEKMDSDVKLRILKKVCSYNYGLIKLMRQSHRTQLKSLLVESFYKIFDPSLSLAMKGEPKIISGPGENLEKDVQTAHLRHTAAQNIILLHFVKLCRNKYDELRLVKHRDLANKILEPLQDDANLNNITFVKMEFSEEDVSSDISLYTSRTTESLVEKCLAFFIYMCKNKLYLTKEIKEEIFKIIDRNKSQIICSPFSRAGFKKLSVEFNSAELSFYLESDKSSSPPEALPEGLNKRQQNILYVQKVMKNIGNLLETQDELDDKQTRFLNFALLALKHHLLKGVDPELFSGLGMTKLVFQYILSDKINAQFRLAFLEILYEYLSMTREHAQLNSESVNDFLNYYKDLEMVNEDEPTFSKKYFRTCRLILRIFPFEDNEIHNQLAVDLQNEVFVNEEAYEKVHVDNLNLLAKVLLVDHSENQNGQNQLMTNYASKKIEERIKTIKPELDGANLQEIVFEFCKENHRKFNIREIGLILELLMLTEQQGLFLRNPKLNGFMGYLKLRMDKQKSPDILYCIDSLLKCTKLSPNFQEYMYHLNFELFFKLSLRRFSSKPDILRPLLSLFLQYTFALEENKFEMSDSAKILIKQSKAYFTELKDEETCLLCMKALVNCSLLKANSKAIVTSGLLQESLIVINQNGNTDIASGTVALLFNIVFAFDKGEIKIADFINSKMINLLHNILQKASLDKNNELVSEVLDLLNAFCQHEYLNFFNQSMIYNLRFTLDNSASHSPTVLKLLSLLRALALCKSARVRKLIKLTFGPRRLMALLQPKSGKKLHLIIKQIISALLEMDKWGPETLANEGLPESVLHGFSLQDNFSVMSINLKIAKLSLVSKNSAFYMQNNCLPLLSHLSGGKSIQKKRQIKPADPEESQVLNEDDQDTRVYPSQIVVTTMDILLLLENHLGSIEELNPVFNFNDMDQLGRMVHTFSAKPKYLELTIKLLANVLENDSSAAKRCPDNMVELLKEVLKSKESPTDRKFLDSVYACLSKLELDSNKNEKYELKNDKTALSYEDKLFLDAGGMCMAIINGRLIQKCGIRYDFVEKSVSITCEKLPINAPKMISSGEIIISDMHLDKLRTASHVDLLRVEPFFKSLFNKSPRPERLLPMSGKVKANDTLIVVSFDLLFDNDFHCKKWNGLLNKIIQAAKDKPM